MCKHVLAIHLAEALSDKMAGILEVKIIEDSDFAPLLLSTKSHLQKYEQKCEVKKLDSRGITGFM